MPNEKKPDDKPKDEDKPLGPAGEAALAKEREAREALEKEVKRLTDLADKAEKDKQAAVDAKKTDVEKLSTEVAELKKAAEKKDREDLRLEVAMAKAPAGMDAKRVRSLAKRLTGATKAELEQDADELLADFTPTKGKDGKDGKDGEHKEPEVGPFGRRQAPKEDLTPGAVPGTGDSEEDPGKVADAILKERAI